MFKKIRVLFLVGVMLSIFAGTANAYETMFKEVAVIDNGTVTRYRADETTIGDFLQAQGITLESNDKVDQKLTDPVYSGLQLNIIRGYEAIVIVDGIGEKMPVSSGTLVGNIIEQLPKENNLEYLYEGLLTDPVRKDSKVVLISKRTEKVTTTEEIPFEKKVVENADLEEGKESTKTEGVSGQKEIITEVVYIGGKESSKAVVQESVTKEPIAEVIEKGTKKKNIIATGIGNLEYHRVITMNATAYTSNEYCTGKGPGDAYFGVTASGMKAQVGVVAVDPKVIPLGTKLYIEGYGNAIAGDTGGAIKGNKIDLYFDTMSEVNNFGRRNITVYVLK